MTSTWTALGLCKEVVLAVLAHQVDLALRLHGVAHVEDHLAAISAKQRRLD